MQRAAPFWLVVAILLAAMAVVQFTTVRQESQTYDEGRQLLSGYTYLISGHFTVGIEHPPLLKLLWAIPVWLLHPDPPAEGEPHQAAHDFLYRNRVPADAMLMAGRCSAIAISVALGWAIAFWARRYFGVATALLALSWYVLDPNFLANGRYIKNDVGAALMIFAASMVWGGYLIRPTEKRLWLAGMVVGMALSTKHSALILGPVMVILYAIRCWQERRGLAIVECLRVFATVAVVALAVIALVFGFAVGQYYRGIGDLRLRQAGTALEEGYLMGEQSETGWWYMSPVALAVKTPLAELAVFLIVLGLSAARLRTLRLRDINFRWFLLAVPAAAYFFVSLLAHSTAGERHLLPLYPFLFVFSAAVLMADPIPRWRWLAVGVTGIVLIAETASVHPHYLAFFNALAGGPAGGREYLVNSNLDWGQDAKNLKRYLDERHISDACISYFGNADLEYYGIPLRPMPVDIGQANCVAAVSVTNLAIYPAHFAELDQRTPDARIGYSIYVYDLRKHPAVGR